MNGCAIVYIPGLTGSISGSDTAGSATSAAKRVPTGDQTGSLVDNVNDSRHGAAGPPSTDIVISRPPFANRRCVPSGDHVKRPRSVSLRGIAGRAPAIDSTNVSFCSRPITPSVAGSGETNSRSRPVGDS